MCECWSKLECLHRCGIPASRREEGSYIVEDPVAAEMLWDWHRFGSVGVALAFQEVKARLEIGL